MQANNKLINMATNKSLELAGVIQRTNPSLDELAEFLDEVRRDVACSTLAKIVDSDKRRRVNTDKRVNELLLEYITFKSDEVNGGKLNS